MKIAIVDDEVHWIKNIEQYVENYFKGREIIIKDFYSGEEFLKCDEEFSVIFMDIEMSGIDGFSTISEYAKKYSETLFIILTSHVEMSREGYKVNAFRYIDKCCLEEIYEALESAELKLCRYQSVDIPITSMRSLTIPCHCILYFEVYGHEVLLYTLDGENNKCSETLSVLAERLKEKGFVLTDRSHLVNLEHIKRVESDKVHLTTRISLPLSRRRYSAIRKLYFNWKMQRANI